MSLKLKARFWARQGKSPDEVLALVIEDAERQINVMDLRLARFVEESTPEQMVWLNKELGIEPPEGGQEAGTEETPQPG